MFRATPNLRVVWSTRSKLNQPRGLSPLAIPKTSYIQEALHSMEGFLTLVESYLIYGVSPGSSRLLLRSRKKSINPAAIAAPIKPPIKDQGTAATAPAWGVGVGVGVGVTSGVGVGVAVTSGVGVGVGVGVTTGVGVGVDVGGTGVGVGAGVGVGVGGV